MGIELYAKRKLLLAHVAHRWQQWHTCRLAPGLRACTVLRRRHSRASRLWTRRATDHELHRSPLSREAQITARLPTAAQRPWRLSPQLAHRRARSLAVRSSRGRVVSSTRSKYTGTHQYRGDRQAHRGARSAGRGVPELKRLAIRTRALPPQPSATTTTKTGQEQREGGRACGV